MNQGDAERARRFPIRMAMRYRSSGESVWRDGVTENMSRTGVLFTTQSFGALQAMEANTPVEFVLTMPPIHGERATVHCQGRVVRSIPQTAEGRAPVIATTIHEFRFLRGSDLPPP